MTTIEQAGRHRLGHRQLRRLGYGAMQLAGPGVFGPPKDPETARRGPQGSWDPATFALLPTELQRILSQNQFVGRVMRMMRRWTGAVLGLAAGLAAAAPSLAWDAPVPGPLPTFAQAGTPALHPWTGFYMGSEIVAGGGKGVKGGVGGAIDFGYNHEFDNRLVLGMQGTTGYSPFALSGSPWRGFDYAAADVKVGYDMGRLMPFVTTGVVLARPVGPRGPDYVTAADATNDLFNGHGDTRAAARIGAGFDYAVTDKFTVGVSASVGNSAAVLAPGGW